MLWGGFEGELELLGEVKVVIALGGFAWEAMLRTVRGLAQILITGTIGLPMMLPCPVGNRCTT